jgi:hypothetical protein
LSGVPLELVGEKLVCNLVAGDWTLLIGGSDRIFQNTCDIIRSSPNQDWEVFLSPLYLPVAGGLDPVN